MTGRTSGAQSLKIVRSYPRPMREDMIEIP